MRFKFPDLFAPPKQKNTEVHRRECTLWRANARWVRGDHDAFEQSGVGEAETLEEIQLHREDCAPSCEEDGHERHLIRMKKATLSDEEWLWPLMQSLQS